MNYLQAAQQHLQSVRSAHDDGDLNRALEQYEGLLSVLRKAEQSQAPELADIYDAHDLAKQVVDTIHQRFAERSDQ